MKKQNISIKYKIAFILIITISFFSISNMMITKAMVNPEYLKIEKNDAKKIALRVHDLLNNEIKTLDDLSRDWASWDDSYQFIKDQNKAYKLSNLTDESLKSSKLNLIVFINKNNEIIFYKGLNYYFIKPLNFLYFHKNRFKKDMLFMKMLKKKIPTTRKKISAIINTIMGPLIIDARPVTDTAITREPNGVIVLGRILDSVRIAELKSSTNIDFKIVTNQTSIKFYTQHLPSDTDYNKPILLEKTPDIIKYAISLQDINNSPVILGVIKYKRSLYKNLISAQNYSFFILMTFISIMTIISIYLIQKIMISPILGISEQLSTIMISKNLNDFKILKRNDELGFLSNMIKKLLSTIVAQQKILSEKAYRDGLTNLLNRRSLDERLTLEFSRLQRSGLPISVIMCDIDFFKKFNDHFGHQAGDRCLISIAKALLSCVGRPGDMVARYGGEEFIVILPESNIKSAVKVAKKIKKAVKDLKIHHPDSEVNNYVTISMGIASMDKTRVKNHEALIKSADKALYKAKENGRNKIETTKIKACKRPKKNY